MKKQICAVRDSALDAFLQPLYVTTTAEATRAFTKEINNPQSPMNDTPGDYDLYHLGEYNPETGKHENIEPNRLIRGKDAKNETT